MKRMRLALAASLVVWAAAGQWSSAAEAEKAPGDPLAAIRAIVAKAAATPEDVAALVEALKSESPEIRSRAAHALGGCGAAAKPAVEALAAALADSDAAVRREAAEAIIRIHPGPAVTIPLAKKLLADADPAMRLHILHTIAEMGKGAVPGLIEALKDDEAARYACLIIADIGPDAAATAPGLVARLKAEKRPEVRRQAISALGAVQSAEGVPALVAALADPQEHARPAAAFALGRIGPAAKDAEAALTKGCDDADATVRAFSAWALVKVKPDDAAVKAKSVDLLVALIAGDDPLARGAALRGLVDLRPGPERVLPILAKHLETADKATAAEVIETFAELGPPAVPALVKALGMPEHRPLVASVLSHLGPAAKEAVPALVEVLTTDKSLEARRAALLALGGIGPAAESTAPAIEAALADPHEKVVLAACYALTKIGPAAKKSTAALEKLAADKDPTIAKTAAAALKAIGDE